MIQHVTTAAELPSAQKIQSIEGVYFLPEYELRLCMHRGMFHDDRHVLMVSCELEYAKSSDMLSVHVTTLTNNEETINVQNKLFCSANEFSNINLAFPMHYLNLNFHYLIRILHCN